MSEYEPPFTLSPAAVSLIADIAAQVERLAIRMAQPDALLLRRANRIESIHSSLAIEGNPLSKTNVADILNGKPVVAPPRQIQEVKNAIAAYDLFPKLNPYSVKDLLKAHQAMMNALIDAPGEFRRSGVSVVNGNGNVLHLAPPAARVPTRINDLFTWLKKAPDHLLVKSCVFHYEFEFIHPFSDGNGRMGRLWQSLILGKWNSAFQHLPIENMVYASHQGYYNAINASTASADSGPFIEFMLREILKTIQSKTETLKEETAPTFTRNLTENLTINLTEKEQMILSLVSANPSITTSKMAENLGVSRQTVSAIIASLKKRSLLRRIGPNKGGHWKIIQTKKNPT